MASPLVPEGTERKTVEWVVDGLIEAARANESEHTRATAAADPPKADV